MKTTKEEKNSNCLLEVILCVTVIFCIVGASLSFYALNLMENPERWTCKGKNSTSDFPINNSNNPPVAPPLPGKQEVLLLGTEELNLRWCGDVSSKPYPLKSWTCVKGNVITYVELDASTIPINSNQTTMKLTMEGPPELIKRLCTVISTTPLLNKLLVTIFSVQFFWGISLLVVSKCEIDKATLKELRLLALFKLLFIICNFVVYLSSSAWKFETVLLVLMLLNTCVLLSLLNNILGRKG